MCVWAGVVTPGLILVSSCENHPDSDQPILPRRPSAWWAIAWCCLGGAVCPPGSLQLRRWCGGLPCPVAVLSPPILRILAGVSTLGLAVVPGALERVAMLGPGYLVLLGCLPLPPGCCVVPVVLCCPLG
uniref:Uncharacterized protein n=1 Tax=Pseudomonas phage vB_PaPhi_Mx1 TaxID=3079664 RepID=A0AAU0N336_9CAUD